MINKKEAKQVLPHYDFLRKNHRGMSGIITILLIIALAIIAIGVVWYVVQNLLVQSEEEINQGADDLFGDCVTEGGTEMVNETHVDAITICSNTVRLIGGEYCCI